MIYPFDFMRLMEQRDFTLEDKRVMARVALNMLIDPQQYPVDLSEIEQLRDEPRVLTHALIAYMCQNSTEHGNENLDACQPFLRVLGNQVPAFQKPRVAQCTS